LAKLKLGHLGICSFRFEEERPEMTNPFKRGSAPGRAQSADQRSGSFKQGHEKRGGRKRGTPNFFSIDYKKALFEAACRIGQDGNGKNGFVGYFSWVAGRHLPAFCMLLTNILVLENAESDTPEEPFRTMEEVNQEVRDYIGLTGKNAATGHPDQVESEAPWAWTGQPFPVGSLMQLAVESPKAFCTLFAAAFLRPPTKRRGRATRQVG
jgi:hypothetical protein